MGKGKVQSGAKGTLEVRVQQCEDFIANGAGIFKETFIIF